MIIILLLTAILPPGCKEKTEPAEPAQAMQAEAKTIEQTTCPVMSGTINKSYYTEYKGKKVYFCCPGCKEQFNEDPEKYIAKLPQFKD